MTLFEEVPGPKPRISLDACLRADKGRLVLIQFAPTGEQLHWAITETEFITVFHSTN